MASRNIGCRLFRMFQELFRQGAWADTLQYLYLDNDQKVLMGSLKDVAFQDYAWGREISARRAEPDEFGA